MWESMNRAVGATLQNDRRVQAKNGETLKKTSQKLFNRLIFATQLGVK
jgi:hypothetical protein